MTKKEIVDRMYRGGVMVIARDGRGWEIVDEGTNQQQYHIGDGEIYIDCDRATMDYAFGLNSKASVLRHLNALISDTAR